MKFFGITEREVRVLEDVEVIDIRDVLFYFMENVFGFEDSRRNIEI